jgi:NFU1 iron-sulfur cluster scaffold homolog, mitochondrial
MAKQTKSSKLDTEIASAIETMRPFIQADGGDISFKCFNAQTGTVEVCLHGACVGCPISAVTLQDGVLENLKLKFKQVKNITISADSFGEGSIFAE